MHCARGTTRGDFGWRLRGHGWLRRAWGLWWRGPATAMDLGPAADRLRRTGTCDCGRMVAYGATAVAGGRAVVVAEGG